MDYCRITQSDNEKYIAYLKQCKQVPADWFPSMLWGYDELVPCERAYADGFCWQRVCEHGETFYYPPIGNWENTDWHKVFKENVTPGTVFNYVPKFLMEMWEKEFSDFVITTDRNKWDYIYDLRTFAAGTEATRRLSQRFKEENEYKVERISPRDCDEITEFTELQTAGIKERHPDQDFTELEEDNLCQARVLSHWDDFPTAEGLLIRVHGKIVSYMIWDAIDERITCMFNKNDYNYRGVHEISVEETCRINLSRGRRWVNYTCDAGIPGLRQAKLARNPAELLEKYRMEWTGNRFT